MTAAPPFMPAAPEVDVLHPGHFAYRHIGPRREDLAEMLQTVGYASLDGASSDTVAFILAFAGGAILTMLATSMIPEAYEHAGRAVGLMTVLGLAVAFGINWLGR